MQQLVQLEIRCHKPIKYRGEMGERVDTGGLSAALAMLGAAGHVGVNDDHPDLFEAPAALPLPLTTPPERTGKAGRPAGARNKSTEQWVGYFLSRYRSPLTALAEIYSRPLEQLYDELQAMADKHKSLIVSGESSRYERVAINPLEVLKMQRDAAAALLPYIHKKQPLALEIDQVQPGIVVLGNLEVNHTGGASDDLAIPLAPIEENQWVIDADATSSDASKSDRVE